MADTGCHVPVNRGHNGPMMGFAQKEHKKVENIHSSYGIGDAIFEKTAKRPEEKHVVGFIIETVKANP